MPHLYPVVIPGGQSIRGQSLGFHAYSLRIDNLSNQWLQEQSTLAWIPPYALGTCIRMYGTAVALVLNATPTGQPQLAPIAGEYASGFFSDEYRTEVAGVPVRQFTLVQTVSDLTQGPEPALPPVGVDRLWADTAGNIHHVHSNGVDCTLVDPCQVGVVTSAMILDGTIQGADIALATIAAANLAPGAAAANVGALGGVLTGTLPNPGLAAASVTTSNLVAGAVTAQLGAYSAIPGFSSSTTGTFLPTPVSVTYASTGARTRLECQIVMAHTVANAQVFSSLYLDGVQQNVRIQTMPAVANQPQTLTLIDYITPSAAGHSIVLNVLNNTAGTLSSWGGINANLWATEERR